MSIHRPTIYDHVIGGEGGLIPSLVGGPRVSLIFNLVVACLFSYLRLFSMMNVGCSIAICEKASMNLRIL